MPVVKRKPTSPGRRFVISVVNPELHKGKGFSPLLAPKKNGRGGATPVDVSLLGTLEVAISSDIGSLTLRGTKMIFPPKLNV
jgi:hypothetical protein